MPKHYSILIKEVIAKSWFKTEPGSYVFASIKNLDRLGPKHLMTINENNGITVVTLEENLTNVDVIERNQETWRILTIRCGNPFYCVGFVATIATAMAEAGIDITITSSFQNDLVMVAQRDLKAAIGVLLRLGFEQRELQ